MEYLAKEEPDILCLQETKCSDSKLPPEAQKVKGFHDYWCHSDQEGYAGLGLYTKVKPISVQCGIGSNDFDKEGRLMVAEFKQFYLINVCKSCFLYTILKEFSSHIFQMFRMLEGN